MLFARVSSHKNGVGDILQRECLELYVGRVRYKAKLKGSGPTLEEKQPDHAIRSSVAITKLPLSRDILKKTKKKNNNKKGKCCFLKIFFSGFLTTFWLSYSIQHHYWFRNIASQFNGEILCKNKYLM